MITWNLLKMLSAKAGECARLRNEVLVLRDDRDDLLLRYNRLMGQYNHLLRECSPNPLESSPLGDRP